MTVEQALRSYIAEIIDKVIREEIHAETQEAREKRRKHPVES